MNSDDINWYLKYTIWCLITLVFTWISAFIVSHISKECEGSGIPELKAILSGLTIYHYFSFQTFLAKFTGLITALIAGLPIGREGPFVHLSACIANKLSKLSWFTSIKHNSSAMK